MTHASKKFKKPLKRDLKWVFEKKNVEKIDSKGPKTGFRSYRALKSLKNR